MGLFVCDEAPRANTSLLVFSDDGTTIGKVSVEAFDRGTVHSRTISRTTSRERCVGFGHLSVHPQVLQGLRWLPVRIYRAQFVSSLEQIVGAFFPIA
jgi:hypothetical protein